MESGPIILLLKESIFMVVVFGVFFFYAMIKGRYALINLIFSLYLALLISLEFPFYAQLGGAGEGSAVAKILIFLGFVIIGLLLHRRHIPGDDYEPAFQGFHKKIILALGATVLVMIFSLHVLPVTEIIDPGSPIQALFAPKEHFFWWLMAPLLILFFV